MAFLCGIRREAILHKNKGNGATWIIHSQKLLDYLQEQYWQAMKELDAANKNEV